MVLTSATRCRTYNDFRGYSKTSSHLNGTAADIACRSSANRFRMIVALMTAGFTRIGVASTFIHVDVDTTNKPKGVMWTY